MVTSASWSHHRKYTTSYFLKQIWIFTLWHVIIGPPFPTIYIYPWAPPNLWTNSQDFDLFVLIQEERKIRTYLVEGLRNQILNFWSSGFSRTDSNRQVIIREKWVWVEDGQSNFLPPNLVKHLGWKVLMFFILSIPNDSIILIHWYLHDLGDDEEISL